MCRLSAPSPFTAEICYDNNADADDDDDDDDDDNDDDDDDTYQLEDVHLQRCVVVDFGAVEMNEEENVGPHVVFQTHMVLKTLNKINSKGLFRLRTFTEN
jgi:hypothetical protein